MNKYIELKKKQQEEINRLPLGFAFGMKQFKEMMEKWGLSMSDTDKILSIGSGGYIQKKDYELLLQTFKRHAEERQKAIAEDKTGDGFIYEMFLYELDSHEYSCTCDMNDTLAVLGYTCAEINQNKCLLHGLYKAEAEIRKRNDR